jgi:hypothetical protein
VNNASKLVIKTSIYPSKDEIRGTVEAYLAENHPEFFNHYAEYRWTAYYNANIHKNVGSFLINWF